MPTNQKEEGIKPTFSKAFYYKKLQMYAKVEQYNKFQCTYHPVLTINSGTVLLQLYPTLHNIILKQIPHITFHPQIFQYVLLKDKELIFFKSSMHVIFRIHETYSV